MAFSVDAVGRRGVLVVDDRTRSFGLDEGQALLDHGGESTEFFRPLVGARRHSDPADGGDFVGAVSCVQIYAGAALNEAQVSSGAGGSVYSDF